jgi:hypothetical protein
MGVKKQYVAFGAALLLLACKDKTAKEAKVSTTPLYHEYRISAEEGAETVTANFLFKRNSENGAAILLEEPSRISLDGKPVQADSAGVSGIYYEAHFPVNEFAGDHEIRFTNADGKEKIERFSFTPFRLVSPAKEQISAKDFKLQFDGVEENEVLHIIVTDTAFTSEGLNLDDSVKNGGVDLSRRVLGKLAPGPIVLQVIKEARKPLQNGKTGGFLQVSYSLRKEFELKEGNRSL